MTQLSFNSLYYSVCQNIKAIDIKLAKIHKDRKTACINRKRRLDKLEYTLIIEELPRLKSLAFKLRSSNYSLFLGYNN